MLTEVSKLQIAMNVNGAACRTQRPRDDLQESGLTRPVFTDNADARLQVRGEVHVAKQYVDYTVIAERDLVELQYWWTQRLHIGEVQRHFVLFVDRFQFGSVEGQSLKRENKFRPNESSLSRWL